LLQEDPYKLVVLAKDARNQCVTTASFFFTEQTLSLVTSDEEGVLRMYEYDPHGAPFSLPSARCPAHLRSHGIPDPDSKNGLELLCRTEYHGQIECRASVTVARRPRVTDAAVPQSKIMLGAPSPLAARHTHPSKPRTAHPDGSLAALVPVDDDASKRLHLLAGQLARHVQHAAGLHPRAHRAVPGANERRGVLDGALLSAFAALSLVRQAELTRQIGTERALVARDLGALGSAW
jgi:cleavage and polyadenylation specificity factor subunit 1